jgi:hypothetical protein
VLVRPYEVTEDVVTGDKEGQERHHCGGLGPLASKAAISSAASRSRAVASGEQGGGLERAGRLASGELGGSRR